MYKFVFVLCLICLFSCKSEDVKFYESSIQYNKNELYKDGIVVIVPGAGCSGCILGIEDFINRKYNDYSNITYVFTNIKSRKLLALKMPDVNFELSRNIIIDEKNIFYNMRNKEKIYPCILFLDNYKIDRIFYVSPSLNISIEDLLLEYRKK